MQINLCYWLRKNGAIQNDRLVEIGKFYEMEMDVGKTKVMSADYDRSKTAGEYGIFQLSW